MAEERKIVLTSDTDEAVEFYVLEETKINGINYLLVTDAAEDEDGTCYILKDLSDAQDQDAVYEFVEDDNEINYLYQIFTELLEDADVDIQK